MRTDISRFIRGMDRIHRRHKFALEAYGKAAGVKMNNFAKANHPWHNRTYNTQNTMGSQTDWTSPDHLKVSLTTGTHYSTYLEFKVFKHRGRLATWWPTVQRFKPEVLRGWAEAVSR